MRVYVASPLGFSEAGRHFYEKVLSELRRLGHDVLDPWKLTDEAKIKAVTALPYGPDKRERWKTLNVEIGGHNKDAIDGCDVVFAVLDGADVDSGTASEIGYAFASHKPIIGYRGDFRLSADNEGSIVNLQVEYFILQSGGPIITQLSQLAEAFRKIQERANVANGATLASRQTSGSSGELMKRETAAHFVILILLALIVRAALETTFRPILEPVADWSKVSALQWAQVVVFFVITMRFYIGARRFVENEPKNVNLVSTTVNFLFAFLLFCTIYAIALAVTHLEFVLWFDGRAAWN